MVDVLYNRGTILVGRTGAAEPCSSSAWPQDIRNRRTYGTYARDWDAYTIVYPARAKWFARAATHYSRGEVDQGAEYRDDAEHHHESLAPSDEPPTATDIEGFAETEGA